MEVLIIKFWAMSVSWRTVWFFVSLGIAEILGFSGLSVLCRGCPTRGSFHVTLGCASAAGTGGVVGFCDLGDRTFEADFNSWIVK